MTLPDSHRTSIANLVRCGSDKERNAGPKGAYGHSLMVTFNRRYRKRLLLRPNKRFPMKRSLLSSTALLCGALLLSSAAFAQGGDVANELGAASTHAQLSESSQSVEVATMHLHHVINCLVGPHGAGFDAAAGNPCKSMGDGALADSPKKSESHSKALRALAAARRGIAGKDLSAMHKAAAEVIGILGK